MEPSCSAFSWVVAVVLETILEWALGDIGQLGIAIALLAALLYWRKMLGLGDVLSTWGGRVAFGLATVGALLILGVIPGLDVERATALGSQAVGVGMDLVDALLGVVG